MVFRDLSGPDIPPSPTHQTPAIAFVFDRFFATVLDFLIFSPVVSLFGAGLLRQFNTLSLIDPRSAEMMKVWCLLAFVSVAIVVILQSVFLYFWQGTPGQIFMQIRVISYPEKNARLTFSQCLIRSSCWVLSFVFLGIPFLEILGHPLRRTFCDRASDSLVVTLKKVYDLGPLPLETRFIASWMRMFFLGFVLYGFVTVFVASRTFNVHKAHNKDESSTAFCSVEALKGLYGDERMDSAISLFLLNAIDGDCLGKEADALLWESTAGNRSLAYVAKGLVADDDKSQKNYFDKACESSTSEVCQLSQALSKADNEDLNLKVERGSLLAVRVLAMDETLEKADYLQALEKISELKTSTALSEALEKRYVRAVWQLREITRKSRAPASVEFQEVLQEFKDRYEVP